MTDHSELLREHAAEERYRKRQRAKAHGAVYKGEGIAQRGLKVVVPTLPEPVRDVPADFQKLLDAFNESSGEQLICYFNPLAVPKVSKTLNINGTYTALGKDGRWELWRPIPESLPAEMFARCQPTIIAGLGTYTRLWTIQDNIKQLPISEVSVKGKDRTFTANVGDYREPDERDIRTLYWCDTARTPEGAKDVMTEIFGQFNERKEAAAEAEFDEFAENMASFYYGLPRTQVGGAHRGNWRRAEDLT
jgi:hypothetical protein